MRFCLDEVAEYLKVKHELMTAYAEDQKARAKDQKDLIEALEEDLRRCANRAGIALRQFIGEALAK